MHANGRSCECATCKHILYANDAKPKDMCAAPLIATTAYLWRLPTPKPRWSDYATHGATFRRCAYPVTSSPIRRWARTPERTASNEPSSDSHDGWSAYKP